MSIILRVQNLTIEFPVEGGRFLRALESINLELREGEVHGIVGESGGGKTVLCLSLLGLVAPPGRLREGMVIWKGKNLFSLSYSDLRRIRGTEIAIIFQNPLSSFNPTKTIGSQLTSIIRLHNDVSRKEAKKEALRLLDLVRISDAKSRQNDYPHQLSGGMIQRVGVAMALACRPQLLIADEPTTSLDSTIQVQILSLLNEIRKEFAMTVIMVSHDLTVVAGMCDRVSVLYLGKIVESADVDSLYKSPKHPYTIALLKADPHLIKAGLSMSDYIHDGNLSAIERSKGCKFHPRCPIAFDHCREIEPKLVQLEDSNHFVACLKWLPENITNNDDNRNNVKH